MLLYQYFIVKNNVTEEGKLPKYFTEMVVVFLYKYIYTYIYIYIYIYIYSLNDEYGEES